MRRLASTLIAFGLLVAVPTAAFAHDALQRTNPGDGTTVAQLPASVVLTFTEDPIELGSQVVVTGPAGPASAGAPTISGRDVTQALDPSAPGGDYTVSYRVTSDDGHPVTGTFSFHATTGLDGSTATAPSTVSPRPVVASDGPNASDGTNGDSGSLLVPILLTIVGTTVLLGVAGSLVLRRREPDRS